MNEPLVSIGLPTYNHPELLRQALECLAGQSYSNLEIIVSDDCSPETETEHVVRTMMEGDPRIKYYRQEKNLGMLENHLFVLEKATGDYFVWASEDDQWNNEFIKSGVKLLQGDPLAGSALGIVAVVDAASGKERRRFSPPYHLDSGSAFDRIKAYCQGTVPDSVFHAVFRRKIFDHFTISKSIAPEKKIIMRIVMGGKVLDGENMHYTRCERYELDNKTKEELLAVFDIKPEEEAFFTDKVRFDMFREISFHLSLMERIKILPYYLKYAGVLKNLLSLYRELKAQIKVYFKWKKVRAEIDRTLILTH